MKWKTQIPPPNSCDPSPSPQSRRRNLPTHTDHDTQPGPDSLHSLHPSPSRPAHGTQQRDASSPRFKSSRHHLADGRVKTTGSNCLKLSSSYFFCIPHARKNVLDRTKEFGSSSLLPFLKWESTSQKATTQLKKSPGTFLHLPSSSLAHVPAIHPSGHKKVTCLPACDAGPNRVGQRKKTPLFPSWSQIMSSLRRKKKAGALFNM